MGQLTIQQEEALGLLVSGKKVSEVAEVLGVHRSTVHRWQREPAFIAARNQILMEIRQGQQQALFDLQQQAVETLRDCLQARNDAVRLRAALSILSSANEQRIGSTDAEQIRQGQEEADVLSQIFIGPISIVGEEEEKSP